MVKGTVLGTTAVIITDNGKTINLMARVCFIGLTEENTKEITLQAKNMETVSLNGQTEKFILVNGKMGNLMEKVR